MKIVKKKLSELKPSPYNPRISIRDNPELYKKLKSSIEKFGLVEPLVWNEQTGNVVGGHQRIEILRDMGIEEVEIVVVNLDLTSEKALNVALNKISGDWNYERLNTVINDLNKDAYDIKLTGFTKDELDKVLEDFRPKPQEDFNVEEALVHPKYNIKRGDIIVLGNHRLMCGDSTDKKDVEKLMNNQKIDIIFTDPPYGVNYVKLVESYVAQQNIGQHKKWRDIENDELQNIDLEVFVKKFLVASQKFWKNDTAIYIFFAMRNAHRILNVLDELDIHYPVPLIWYKNSIMISWNRYHPDYELIVYCGPGSVCAGNNSRWYGPNNESCVWNVQRDSSTSYLHPTQKPVELAERAIQNSTKSKDVVVDLFGGSGSTLIACEQTGRVCYMMEIDPVYCSIIIERWESLTKASHSKL